MSIKQLAKCSTLLFIVVYLLLGGCATAPLDSAYRPSGDESIIVLGIEPQVKQLTITPGEIDNDSWYFRAGFSNRPRISPREGFVVVSLEPRVGGESYGIYQILPTGLWGDNFVMKKGKGACVPTFEAHPGSITYVGTIFLDIQEHTIEATVISNFEAAKKHIEKFYPQFLDDLTEGRIQFLKFGGDRYW